MKYPTREQGRAVTSVFWDINLCPVPSGFDPSRVRPCIKQYLENRGYSHLVNITAVGVLVDVPARVLRSVFSSGISLINVPYGDTSGVVCAFAENNPPSEANIMVISDPNIFTGVSDYIGYTGHHLLEPCPYDSLQSLLEKDSGAPDEETVESALWDCLVCRRDPPSHVFEDLITHLRGEEHEELFRKRFTLDNGDDVDFAPPAVSRRDPFMTWDWCPLLSGPRVTKQEAATFVFWDINTYPVSCCSDVPLVAPCIKRFLAVEGYFGPCVIVAAGLLTS
ncbi:PREDICTED: uncharacterized protein LOC104731996 [Camelina sativa]|uniref:Uncharacterized protein LOC104731996 n=1 Tax=Camelina sativa TaxID=90675 RepID=A0ABM0V2I0_CAMSA|nr:PREDICTED: uncharacterized protein LOC104731996 [Camelina sativa]